MRIIDWGSDVCSSDLGLRRLEGRELGVEASELLFEPRLVGVLARLDLLELVGERFALLVERGLDSVEQAIGRDHRVAYRAEREGDAGVGRRVVRRVAPRVAQRDRKSTRLKPVTNVNIVYRLV